MSPRRDWIAQLADAGGSSVILGEAAVQHAEASWLRAAAKFIARATGSGYNEIPSGANAIGLADAGVAPQKDGRDAAAMLRQSAEEPDRLPGRFGRFRRAGSVRARPQRVPDFYVYMGAYACAGVRSKAHAVLPIGLPPEIDASYTNVDGTVQTIAAAATLPGEARPGWKVLRALGSALALDGFGFTEIGEVRAQMGKAPTATTAGEPERTSAPIGAARRTRSSASRRPPSIVPMPFCAARRRSMRIR